MSFVAVSQRISGRTDVAEHAGEARDALAEVADVEIADFRKEEPFVADVVVALQGHDVAVGFHHLGVVQRVFAEDVEPEVVKVAVQAPGGLGDLAVDDALEGEGHRPVFPFLFTDVLPVPEAVAVAGPEHLFQVALPVRPGHDAGHLLQEGVRRLFAGFHGAGHFDPERPPVGRLQVRPVAVLEPVITGPEQRPERHRGILFKEIGSVFAYHPCKDTQIPGMK